MKLALDHMNRIPATYPKTFYRVSTWNRDVRVADFDNKPEAAQFAIEDSGRGNLDHRVSTLHMTS